MTSSILPCVSFGRISGPFTLTSDENKTDGKFTLPGLTAHHAKQTMTIGGVSQSTAVKDGALSLGDTTVNIIGGSWTDKGGETLSMSGSVTIAPNFTVTFEGSDAKKGVALSFTDDKAEEEAKKMIRSGSVIWKYETDQKDPNYDTAGVIPPGQAVAGWSKKLTFSVTLGLNVVAGAGPNKEIVSVQRTYKASLGLRPYPHGSVPDPPAPPGPHDPPFPIIIPVPIIIPFKDAKGVMQVIHILGRTSKIQETEIKAAVEKLAGAESDATKGAATAQSSEASMEAELGEATELETSLSAEGAAAEETVAAAGAAEGEAATAEVAAEVAAEASVEAVTTATAELSGAVAGEVAADASEAADWWTIIGGIISAGAIAAATAAVVAATSALANAKKKKTQAHNNQAKANATKRAKAAEKAGAQKKVDGINTHKADTKKRIQDLQGKIDATKAQEAVLKESFTSIKAAKDMLEHHAAQLSPKK